MTQATKCGPGTPVMTKAQVAIEQLMTSLIEKVGKPMTLHDIETLIEMLRKVEHDSLWGTAISNVFENGGDVNLLIKQLASQSVDDPFTMSCIVGMKATIMLLRSFPVPVIQK